MSENISPTPPVEPTPPGYDPPASATPEWPVYQQPASPSYEQPVAPSYQQPYQQPMQQQPYQQSAVDASGNVSVNYWLSVFFTWIPALIFFLTDRGKNSLADEFHKANLNFSLLRIIVSFATAFLFVIPFLGIILGILCGLASVVLFFIHIVAAIEAPKKFRSGQPYKFPFNIALIK